MNTTEIAAFFDALAPRWDEGLSTNADKVNTILTAAQIQAGNRVLDVGCGTGVLFRYYLERRVNAVTGVDISREMLKLAEKKYGNEKRIQFICRDVLSLPLEPVYDNVMVFNAFPHLINPEAQLLHLASALIPGGTLTVAHDISLKAVEICHEGAAKNVSNAPLSENELSVLFEKAGLCVTVRRSDDEMFIVSGQRSKP